jgi:glycosyltransferase involved in cell wall biosynthesis
MKTGVLKVCHISTVHPLFDDRIFYKECITLAENSYSVFLVIVNNVNETIEGVNIVALNKPKNRLVRLTLTSIQAFLKVIKIKPDVVHIHDPELLWIGLLMRFFGKATIYDVHEDVSKQIFYKPWLKIFLIKSIVSSLFFLSEKLLVLSYSRVIAVTEDIEKKFPRSKTVLVRNFPRLNLISLAKPKMELKSGKTVIYVGSLTKERGIYELICSMDCLDAELWLLGPWGSDEFCNVCMQSVGWRKTKYFGIKKLEEVYCYLKCADIGIALLYPTKNYLTSLPVKAFEYMAAGVPMVVSDFPYWRKVFSGSAIFANPYDPEDIANKILFLLENSNERERVLNSATLLIKNQYSWEAESQKLLSLYSGLI